MYKYGNTEKNNVNTILEIKIQNQKQSDTFFNQLKKQIPEESRVTSTNFS